MSSHLGKSGQSRAETVNLKEAAALLGVSRTTAYVAARDGTLGVPVLRIRGTWKVPARPLRKALGLDS